MTTKKTFPVDCVHRNFFGCKSAGKCKGCYYHPVKAESSWVALREDSPVKLWFYSDKKHSKACIALLDDIKNGRGLFENGRQCRFKYKRLEKEDDDGQEIGTGKVNDESGKE